jgi:hypothetical protein
LQDVVVRRPTLREVRGHADGVDVEHGDPLDSDLRHRESESVGGIQRKIEADAVVGNAQFIGQHRRENVSVGNQRIPILVCLGGEESGKRGGLAAHRFVHVRLRDPHRKLVGLGQLVIDPRHDLALGFLLRVRE